MSATDLVGHLACGFTPVPVPSGPVVLRPQDGLRVLALLVSFGRSAPSVGGPVLSMNPLSLEGTTMVPTTFIRIRSLFRPRRVGINSHPDAVSEASLNLPRRIDDPTSAAQLTRDLLRNHREDITMVLYLDDRHRLVGTAILTIGWVQAACPSGRHPLRDASVPVQHLHPRPLPPLRRSERHRTRGSLFPYHRRSMQPVRRCRCRSPSGGRLTAASSRPSSEGREQTFRVLLPLDTLFPYHQSMSRTIFPAQAPLISSVGI